MSRSVVARIVSLTVIVLLQAAAVAHEHGGMGHGGVAAKESRAAASICSDPVPACAISATPAFDTSGALRLIYSVSGRVYLARSNDDGRTFETATAISKMPAEIDDNYDGRPTMAIARDGTTVAAWSVWRDKNWNGMVLTARSTDSGRTFSPPVPITQSVSQRFASIAFAPDGALWATWLDKRNLAAAKAAGDDYSGAGLAISVSRDAGATFAPANIVADRTCECCRVSMDFDADGAPVIGWRQIFGKNFRDHEVGRVSADGRAVDGVRVSEDNWAIDACPHHGPNLSVDADGMRHLVWYTGGDTRNGLFYAHAAGQGAAFTAPQAFGDPAHAPSHPQVLSTGASLVRAWKEFDGERTSILLQTSSDRGAQWTPALVRASTGDASDHPILIARNGRVFLSWLTKTDGYRLLPVDTGGER